MRPRGAVGALYRPARGYACVSGRDGVVVSGCGVLVGEMYRPAWVCAYSRDRAWGRWVVWVGIALYSPEVCGYLQQITLW